MNIDTGDLKQILVYRLERVEEIIGVPLEITSGFRTPEENKKAGGVNDSSHLTGEAVDISCRNSSLRYTIINTLLLVGFKRIGIGKTFIHCDISKTKPEEVLFLE